jgi:hypothetical protein
MVGALASDATYLVGVNGTEPAPEQVAYLALHPSGSVALETADADDPSEPRWLTREDGTVAIPVGWAPSELDLRALRRALLPTLPLEALLTVLRRDRQVVSGDDGTGKALYPAATLSACTTAAVWVDDMIRHGEFVTGRSVQFAEELLSREMFIVPNSLSASAIKALAKTTERRFAKENIRLLGVLPWLEAQVAPPARKQRRHAHT